jgi:uncharacterized protein DUF2716
VERAGWTVIESDDQWDRFERRFGFQASPWPDGWPAVREPTPSITFDLSPIFDREGPHFASGVHALNAEVLRAFAWQLSDLPSMVVLDWQHATYRLDVATFVVSDWTNRDLPLPFPNGDYYAFLSEDMTEGTFGHPWEKTLLVLGQRMTATLGETLKTWLPVKRINGKDIAA